MCYYIILTAIIVVNNKSLEKCQKKYLISDATLTKISTLEIKKFLFCYYHFNCIIKS